MAAVTLIGATGRVGRLVLEQFRARGTPVIAVVRDPARLGGDAGSVEARVADIDDPAELRGVLADARLVVSCARAWHTEPILAALPPGVERAVFMGSTRKFTRFPDHRAEQVRAAERAFESARVPAAMIHPSMIYGSAWDNNVHRIAALIRRFGVVPLPGGGHSLIQPIHVDDVVRCLLAALDRAEALGPPIVVAGPAPMTYRDFVAAIGRAIGLRAIIIPISLALALAGAAISTVLPLLPRFKPGEMRRLYEDKAFSIEPMRARLGVEPIGFDEGLARSFARAAPDRAPAKRRYAIRT